MPKAIKCPGCGTITKTLKFNGYSVGDRLLEGVIFVVKVEDNGNPKVIGVDKASKAYFSQLNEARWITEAQDYVDCMVDDVFAGCPNCEYDIIFSQDQVETDNE